MRPAALQPGSSPSSVRTRRKVSTCLRSCHLDRQIIGAVVGEGSLDDQSRFGKTPVGIARRAGACGAPTIAAVGTTTLPSGALKEDGIVVLASAVDEAPNTAEALTYPARYLKRPR